jgi:hypothetical protein
LNKALIAAVAAGIIVGGGVGAGVTAAVSGGSTGAPSAGSSGAPSAGSSASPTTGQDGGESPPDCIKVAIAENSGSGPVLWTKWCGTGSRGDAPIKAHTGQLVVDGASLDPANCTQANPCVILWPSSPKS